MVLHKFDHERPPLAVRGRVVEQSRRTPVDDIVTLNVAANEERSRTEVRSPASRSSIDIGHRISDLHRRSEHRKVDHHGLGTNDALYQVSYHGWQPSHTEALHCSVPPERGDG